MANIIDQKAIENRKIWINKIKNCNGNFADDTKNIEKQLKDEIKQKGIDNLIAHLRLCGHIPELYNHDILQKKNYIQNIPIFYYL